MKKHLLIAGILLLLVLAGFTYVFWDAIPEIPSRLSLYHNAGTINVTLDGVKLDLKETELSYKSETGETIDKVKLNNGKFKFEKGLYGFNIFTFSIPNVNVNPLVVEFGQFNTNWWHICKYTVDVQISTNSDKTLTVKMNTEITVNDDKFIFEDTKIITTNDNIISNL